jgi:Zn-dependent peptidase ImmA (M78 family)
MKKKKQVDPEVKQLLTELEEIVQRLGYKLRYEKGNFEGGYCLLKESRLFVINSRNDAEKRIVIIAKNIKELGIDDIFIKPQVREVIEKESSKTGSKPNQTVQ